MELIPERFKQKSAALFGSAAEHREFIEALENGSSVRSLRVNEIKISKDAFEKAASFDIEKLDFCGGYRFFADKIGADSLHHAGAYYVQDPSAMCTVEAIKEYIKPDFAVLDMCAAPGGKSTQAAQLLDGGFLVSNEIDFKRCRVLRSNTERMGHRRTVVTSAPPERLAKDFCRFFDLVIVDAPCSGEGMFRKYPEAAEQWSDENVSRCARRQRDILESAAQCVTPGGYLLYSTCTFSIEENEETADAFLTVHPEFSIVPVSDNVRAVTADGIDTVGRPALRECRRFYPHLSPGEGQFICLMQKERGGERGTFAGSSVLKPVTRADSAPVNSFFEKNISVAVPHPFILRDTVMLAGDLPCPEYTLCCGVAAGQVQKGRFEPHHHLFSAYGNAFYRRVFFDDGSDAAAYLRGETVEISDSENGGGWCGVIIEGCAAGGGKIVGQTLKNHYPKGLRSR